MPIIKVKRESYFAIIPNETARDKRLGLDSRGFLCEILSHTEDLNFSVEGLMEHFGIGRDKLLRITKELKTFGYLETPQLIGEKGFFEGVEWVFYNLDQTGVRETRTADKPHPPLKKEENQEEKKENTLLRKGASSNSSEKPKKKTDGQQRSEDPIWGELLYALIDHHGADEIATRKELGALTGRKGYGVDFVQAIYAENRKLILDADEPLIYLRKLLQIQKNTTPEDREADKQLREAKRYHIALYANMEYIPDFNPATYTGRFPLISKFIQKEKQVNG